jgi:hypothetical protein
MATEEQLAAFQTAVASGNIQEAANIAALAGYSPQQVAEYVNANAPILGLGPETGFSGVTAANLDPYFAGTPAPVFDSSAEKQRMQAQFAEAERLKQIELERPIVDPRPQPTVAAPPPPVVVQEQGDPLKGALALYDQYLLAGQYPEAKALLDSTIATYGLNPTESYANMATYLNTEPKFEDVRKAAENKLFTSENIANFGKLSPAASVGPAGGIYQRTPQEQAAYASQLASIPVNTAVPLPVMPMSIGPSAAMARIQRTGEMTPEQYYSNIRESVSSGQYTPAQLRQMQQGVGASSQDINVAFGRGMTPITTTTPTMPGATADTTQSIGQFIQSRAPTTSVAMPTAPSMFSPENVRAQLELERLRLQPTPEPPPEEPVAGFAQGGLVSDDINRMLQNQRNAVMRESQSRQMLTNLGAPPVKKFSDGGPAGSSSGVRRLKMSGYQEGGEVTDEMFVGTRPTDFPETSDVDKKAGELLRALSEGTRGFVGAEPIEAGSEAYRTGQALANMPAVGVVAATAKGAGKAKDALKALTKKDIKLIASELETSRGQLAELAKKYPQLRDASVADIEALTKGEPFTAFRGISLLPGRELRKESTPSMTVDPSVALGMLKDAPVMITKEGFITATPVLRQYPGMKASETQVYVPSLIEQITERQPGALEMKIPTRSGEKMTVADVFKEVKGEKELLADVSKKEPRDILFDRYQGGVGDRYLMEVARRVLAGKWDGGEALLKEIGGYQTDPKGLVQEFDSFAELVKESALKKAQGGEVTNDEFIQEMMVGTRPTDLPVKRQEEAVSNDNSTQEMFTGTRPSDFPETSPVDTAVSDFISSRSKLVTDPQEFFRVMGQNIEEYHGKPLREDPEKYLMEQLGPGALAGIIKMPGGNYLAGQVEKALAETKTKIPWTNQQISEMPQVAKAHEKDLALNKFIETKLTKYVKNDMATERDPLRLQADKWATEQQPKLLAEKDAQIVKAKADMEKAQRERGVEPEMLTRSRARILELEKEREFIAERTGLHYVPRQIPELYRGGVNFARQNQGFPSTAVARSEAGKLWEDFSDRFLANRSTVEEVTAPNYFLRDTDAQRIMAENPWLSQVPPETQVRFLNSGLNQQDTGFKHMADELRNALNPSSGLPPSLQISTKDLEKMTVPQAADLVDRINAHRAVQKAEANKLAAQKSIEVYKEYPETEQGLRWVEMKIPSMPEDFKLPEGYKVVKDDRSQMQKTPWFVRGPDGDIISGDRGLFHATPEEALKNATEKTYREIAYPELESALKYEGDVMQHCVGGYCPDVAEGRSRIFSLRDNTGKPAATVEVKSSNQMDPSDFYHSDAIPESLLKKIDDAEAAGALDSVGDLEEFVRNSPEFKAYKDSLPLMVTQIKGAKNLRPEEKYLPFVQDFLKTQKWSSIGDLQNAGLVQIKPMLLKNAQDKGLNPQVITTVGDQIYVTKEEFNRLADLFGGMNKYAAGGEVTNDEFIQQVMTGTPMSDTSTRPGILPPELREAIDVPLDFANLLIRGTAAVPIGGFAGLYKGLTGGKYGTQEGVKEADTEAARMMAEITGEPKTQTAKDVLQFVGDKMQEYKLDAPMPQLLTLPSPGAGTTEFIKQAVRSEFEAPPVGAVTLKPDASTDLETAAPSAGGASIRPEQLDQLTSQTVIRGQDIPPLTKTPTPEEIRVAKADTRMGQNIVADRLNIIVPETERVRGGIYRAGQPSGRPWSELTPEQLKQRDSGFKGTDNDLDKMWQETLSEVSEAGRIAVERTGATWKAFPAKNWDNAFKLPLRNQLWYELSGEAFVDRMPDTTTREMLTFLDLIGATSARAKPLENLERSVAISAQKLQGVPVDVDVTIPSTVKDALRREGTNISSDLANKTGNFSDTLALTGGLPVRYPISVNDVWVGNAFGITDQQLGANQALHEVFARYMNKVRDFHNETGNPLYPHESWQVQARQWVEMRANALGIDTSKLDTVEGSDYAAEFDKVVKKLENAGISVPDGILTRDVLLDPRIPDALRTTTKAFREAPKATVEFGTLLTPSGKRGAELFKAAKAVGDELTQKEYLKVLTSSMYDSARGKPTPWQNLVRVATNRAESVTRIYSPTSQDPFAISGTFQGAAGPNIRIPFRDMTPDQIAYANAVAGSGLKQKAMAAAEIRRLELNDPIPKGYVQTNSIKFDIDGPVPESLLVDITKELGKGFEVSAMRYPDGLMVDINPRFGDAGPEAATVEAIDRATDMLEERYKAKGVKAFRSAYRSEFGKNYVEDPGTGTEYNRIIQETLKGWNDEAITRITDLAGNGVKRSDISKFLAGKLDTLPIDASKLPEGTKADGVRGRTQTIRKQLRQRISDHNESVKAFESIGQSVDGAMAKAIPTWEKRAQSQRKKLTTASTAQPVARRRGKGTTSAAEDLAAVSPTAPAVSRVEKTKIKKAKGGEISITDFIKRAA